MNPRRQRALQVAGAARLRANPGHGTIRPMSPELIAILAVGVALTGVILAARRDLRGEMRDRFAAVEKRMGALEERMAALERGHAELRERLARLEGLLDGLREAVAGRRTEAAE